MTTVRVNMQGKTVVGLAGVLLLLLINTNMGDGRPANNNTVDPAKTDEGNTTTTTTLDQNKDCGNKSTNDNCLVLTVLVQNSDSSRPSTSENNDSRPTTSDIYISRPLMVTVLVLLLALLVLVLIVGVVGCHVAGANKDMNNIKQHEPMPAYNFY